MHFGRREQYVKFCSSTVTGDVVGLNRIGGNTAGNYPINALNVQEADTVTLQGKCYS